MTHVDTPQTLCRAAVARGDITPPVGIYHRLWGAAAHDRATGVHRPLLATLLWVEPAEGPREEKQLIVALDHCILDGDELAKIVQAVSQAVPILPDQVHVALSHTHGSGWMSRTRAAFPGGELIGPYLDNLASTIAALAADAHGRIRPAAVVYGQGRCDLAAHRDFWDADKGRYVCGFNPAGPADDTVLVARITGEEGDTLATMVNYACHPTTLAWDNLALSPDYVGAMREVVEQHTRAPCVFLQGASGDLGPREGFVGDWGVADRNGRQLGFAVLSALEALPKAGTRFVYAGPVLSGTMIGTWNHEPLSNDALHAQSIWQAEQFTVHLPYRPDLPTLAETKKQLAQWESEEVAARDAGDNQRARECRALVEQMRRQMARLAVLPEGETFPYVVTLCRLGDACWLLVPGELYQTFQVALRAAFRKVPIVVATLTNGWQPGYLPAATSYGYGIYQDVIAVVAPGSLEMLIEAISRRIATEESSP